jgi:hypothetical protein
MITNPQDTTDSSAINEIPARPSPTTSIKNVQGIIQEIGNESVTARAEFIRHNTDEQMIWQESPSIKLITGTVLRWIIFCTLITLLVMSFKQKINNELQIEKAKALEFEKTKTLEPNNESLKNPLKNKKKAAPKPTQIKPTVDDSEKFVNSINKNCNIAIIALLIIAASRILWVYLTIKTTRYMATSQRLVIESGVLISRNIPYELHKLGNAIILRPFTQRILGLSNLHFPSNGIRLRGLKNADYVRDVLRSGGQIEAQRMDKIRWR